MKKLLLLLGILFAVCIPTFAAKIPNEVKDYILNEIPNTDIRFDGVIITPSNTIYLPLYPSLFSDIKSLKIKETYPQNLSLKEEPNIVIFNNDFVLLKVLSDGEGHKTVMHLTQPPLQVRTGLLPQDMLVPSGLIIPENIKGIIGNLKIDTKSEDIIRVNNEDSFEEFLSDKTPVSPQEVISQLKGKQLFVTTNYSKNIQVVEPAHSIPEYSLAQKSIPIDIKAVNDGKFLLVTSYERPFLDIVSVSDSRFIKQIPLNANPEQILIDEEHNRAYVASPSSSMIFTIDLKTMNLIQKIKINGYCEHLILSEGKLFYVDKLNNRLWAIELNNDYLLKDIGKFPNVSAIAFANNKIFVASRTKSRIAVIDYDTFGLIQEFTTVNKPISMLLHGKILYILGAQNNEIQLVNVDTNNSVGKIELGTTGFSSGLKKLDGTNLGIALDLKNNYYSFIDLDAGKLIKTYSVNIPIKDIIVADKVKLFK